MPHDDKTSEQRPPTVSIIIPVYNDEEHVGRAIESALAQTLKEVELIVVDDGSTDGTPEVLKRYEGRVKVIRQENKGVAAARNAGISRSSGKYISFLDSDDWISTDMCEILSRFLDNHGDVGLCFGGWECISEDTGHPYGRGAPPLPANLMESLAFKAPFPTPPVQVRREWLERVGGFDEAIAVTEDFDLWRRLYAEGCKFALATQSIVASISKRESSYSRTAQFTHLDSLRLLDKYFLLLGERAPEGLEARAKARIWTNLGALRMRLRGAERARQPWETARALWPDVFTNDATWEFVLKYLNPRLPYFHPDGLPDYKKTWREVGSILRSTAHKQPPSTTRQARELSAFAFALSWLAFSRAKSWRARAWLARALVTRPRSLLDPLLIRTTVKIVMGRKLTRAVQSFLQTLRGAGRK